MRGVAIIRAGIVRHPTCRAGKGHLAVIQTATTAAPTRAPRNAAHPHPRHTRTAHRPPQTRSRRRRKRGATRASRCPRRSSPSHPGARTVARCGTDSGTGVGITSRWTSMSCTHRTTAQTRPSWRDTLSRRRGTRTTMATLSSTIPRGGNCRKVCRGRGSPLCYPMIRSVCPTPITFPPNFFSDDV